MTLGKKEKFSKKILYFWLGIGYTMNKPSGGKRSAASASRVGGTEGPRDAPPWGQQLWWFGVAGLVAIVLFGGALLADWWLVVPESVQPSYLGSRACAQCHEGHYRQWLASHHAQAMQEATADTVLGDFENAELTYHGITARMFRRDGKYWIHTQGPDGQMHDYQIKYTFGVAPLQQYLVEFDPPDNPQPNTVGRLQVLRECWDTQRGRWFYLPPPDVPDRLSPEDDLHWTGIGQRWNTMCAECHSTNVQKNFDPATGTYRTTFSEISVGCEACHGPGSLHVQLAQAYSFFWDRKRGYGLVKLKGNDPQVQVETCAFCHSRRRVLDLNTTAQHRFADRCALEIPSRLTYFADGQIMDEVYEIGSFLQSKMYHQKIRCTDCHDPHTAQLKYSGNALCTSCHQHPAGRYDSPSHHQHRPGSTGSLCINCHMPETVYMEVDARRDHSLRVPRPDLSLQYGVPNACTGCHLDRAVVAPEKRSALKQYRDWVVAAETDEEIRSALRSVDAWADGALQQWFPLSTARRSRHYVSVLAAAWRDDPQAAQRILELCRTAGQPAIVRAAGWQWLRGVSSPDTLEMAVPALHDPDPWVRLAAVGLWEPFIPSYEEWSALSSQQLEEVAQLLQRRFAPLWPLLNDPVKAVRVETAALLGRLPKDVLPLFTDGRQRAALQAAINEWIETLKVYNDRAGSHLALGVYYEAQGDESGAAEAYQTAMRVEPRVVGPRSNLAALLERQQSRLEMQLRQAAMRQEQALIERFAQEAEKLHQRVTQLRAEELQLLARDARLAPNNTDVLYRYGLALYLNGRQEEAAQVLESGAAKEQHSPRFLYALALLYQKLKQYDKAIEKARRLIELSPTNTDYQSLLESLQKEQGIPSSSP